MKSLNGVAVVAAWSGLAAGGAAHAQEAVQWRVEDGGNGHWYQRSQGAMSWSLARDIAVSRGGHLATLTSTEEHEFLMTGPNPLGVPGAWLGGFRTANGQPWQWVSGELFEYSNWCPQEPSNSGSVALQLWSCAADVRWDDTFPDSSGGSTGKPFLVEWSADCNGDGIVDYGQILDGTLLDLNLNGIPDCCDIGSDCASPDCDGDGVPDADEIASGHPDCNQNGIPDECDYGGVLLTPLQSPFGNDSGLSFTFREVDAAVGDVVMLIDARADLGSTTEFATLAIDGETIDVLWIVDGEDCPAEAQFAEYIIPADEFNALAEDGEVTVSLEASPLVGAKECPDSFARVTIQYATTFPDCNGNGLDDNCELADGTLADCDGNGVPDTCDDAFPDCNANGIPDLCDIADGTLADCNGNGQPDSCEVASWPDLDCDGDGQLDECQIAGDAALDENEDGILDTCSFALGDFDLDGMVGGSDLAVMLSLWGEKNVPFGDLTGDGLIDGADLANLLGNWGPYQGVWGSIIELLPDPEVVTDPEWRDRIIATGLPWRVRDNASQIEMLLVPPGTFMMGCSPSDQWQCPEIELPIHQVTLTRAFYLGRYEVTQAQWSAVMGTNPSFFQSASSEVSAEQVPHRPVDQVSWNDIQTFELETGLRLPTEAEWEYACRAGTVGTFNLPPGGTESEFGDLGWYSFNSSGQTRPVGLQVPNALGLHDMHGNVWEWCEDWFSGDYYSQATPIDPTGPNTGSTRVLRGGSWNWRAQYCRSPARAAYGPGSYWFNSGGFRAARTP